MSKPQISSLIGFDSFDDAMEFWGDFYKKDDYEIVEIRKTITTKSKPFAYIVVKKNLTLI